MIVRCAICSQHTYMMLDHHIYCNNLRGFLIKKKCLLFLLQSLKKSLLLFRHSSHNIWEIWSCQSMKKSTVLSSKDIVVQCAILSGIKNCLLFIISRGKEATTADSFLSSIKTVINYTIESAVCTIGGWR